MRISRPITLGVLALLLQAAHVGAEDQRTQYPFWMSNSYVDVDIGYINYPFSAVQLEPGFKAESVQVPHAGVRLVLFGHRFNEYLAAQISYMRPVQWVRYKNVNGTSSNRSVWMNVAGVSLRSTVPVAGPFSIRGELGLGIVTRSGFSVDDTPVVKDATYPAVLLGGGLRYRFNDRWDIGATATYTPARASVRQPHTVFFSGGFTYNMRPLPPERVKENAEAGYAFPRNLLQVGYATDAFGTGVNHFVSSGAVPIFWGGLAAVEHGFALHYERNMFHSRKVFSLDLGASLSTWRSAKDRQKFYTASVFPVLRFTPLRLDPGDLYFCYSVAGPTTISSVSIDGLDTGRHFTFQDFMGLGAYLGKKRNVNTEVRIGHYSNGNLFPKNAGVSIPLTFSLGVAF